MFFECTGGEYTLQNEMGLQQVIYELIETLIKFGVHRYGDPLPTIKDASSYFLASADTVRLVYVRLKHEGYIYLSTGVGATVKVQYSDDEIRQHIKSYFSLRKSTLLAFARSAHPLFGYAQWMAWKNISVETLDELERICLNQDICPPYRMSRQLMLIYGKMGNELFIRLIWQMFTFFQGPFLSVFQNILYFKTGNDPLLNMINLCRDKNWTMLQQAFDDYEKQRLDALYQFFDDYEIPDNDKEEQVDFDWNIYKKTSQICYSLCLELLIEIRQGRYTAGSCLPSLSKLASEKEVGLTTVRRTISLLNHLGAVQSVNGVGTKVLLRQDSAENCDFTNVTIRKRLLDFLHSLHILSLSCRACAQCTIESMTQDMICDWLKKMEGIKRSGFYLDLLYCCYEQISLNAPYSAIQSVYGALSKQFFWGFPLQNLHGDQVAANAYYLPYLENLQNYLRCADSAGFAKELERMQIAETELVAKYLVSLNIHEASVLFIPEAD